MKRYEQVPHTADLAARIHGQNEPELFENASFAMFDMMADLKDLGTEETLEVRVEASDKEGLLVSWLNELLYSAYIKQFLFSEFHIKSLEDKKLVAEVKGQKIAGDVKRIRSEIKAATYHDLKIQKTDSGYEVTVVFDV